MTDATTRDDIADPPATADARVRAAIAAVREGDVEAFAVVVRAYQDRLLGYLIQRCPDPAQAEDLAQVVLVAAYEGLERYDADRDFGGWLFGIAANHLRKAWERAGREQRGLASLGDRARSELGRWAEREEDRQRAASRLDALAACLGELPERWRELLGWHYDEGWSLARIAEVRGSAASTVGVTLHRARRRLRVCIEGRLAEELT